MGLGARRVAGIFVGGASRRMGGKPKGWLPSPGDGAVSVIERTIAVARAECDDVVLVGRADAYARLGLAAIADAVPASGERAEGPLGGLVGLLESEGDAVVVALACDMPYLTRALLARLLAFDREAVAVAPREGGDTGATVWSPLFARYHAAHAAPVARAILDAGERSLRAVLASLSTSELPLSSEERRSLRDWDSPTDIDAPDRNDQTRTPS
jgi:molybdopterin-guanine dinucleotide biosynthesis protein A